MKMLLDYDVMLEILERLDSGENRFDDLKDNGDVVTLYLDGPEDDAEGKTKIYDFEKVRQNRVVEQPLRKCIVDDRPNDIFLFHTWYDNQCPIIHCDPNGNHHPVASSLLVAILENEKTGEVIQRTPLNMKFLKAEHDANRGEKINEGGVVHAKWYDGRCTNCCHEALEYLDDCRMVTYITDYCPNCGAKMDGDK